MRAPLCFLGVPGDSFDPVTDPNLVAWYRADLGISLFGSDVANWANQRGSDVHTDLQGNTLNYPTFVASNSSYNNQPTVHFPNTMAYSEGDWSTPLLQPCTIFMVADNANTTGEWFDGDVARAIVGGGGAAPLYMYAGNLLTGTALGSSKSAICAVFNGASSALYVSAKTPTVTGDAGSSGIDRLSIGFHNVMIYGMNGDVGELLVFDKALDATERGGVWSYISNRYAITIGA